MKKRGISLIEVVIAVSILAMFTLPMFVTLMSNHKGTAILKEEINAVLLAFELVDQLKLIPVKYVDGFGEKEINDGEQPLWTYFKTTSLYGAIKSNPKELNKVKGILYLVTSKLPPKYKRKIKIYPKNGFFAKFSVTISYKTKDMKGKLKNHDLVVSGIMVDE